MNAVATSPRPFAEHAPDDVARALRDAFGDARVEDIAPLRGGRSGALLLTFVGTFYETEGAFLIGAPHVRTMPVLMISLINNQLVVQYGAVLSVMLWVPSFLALLFARKILSARTIAGGLGA